MVFFNVECCFYQFLLVSLEPLQWICVARCYWVYLKGGGLLKIGVCEQVGSLKHHLLAQARVCVVSSPSSERNLGW